MSKAAIRAPIRSTPNSSSASRQRHARFCAFGMTKRPGRSAANDPGARGPARRRRRRDRLCREVLGLSRPCRARLHARGKPRGDRRQRESRGRRRARGDGRLRAFLRRLQGQSEICACSAPRPRSKPARAGRCSATPTAARCRTKSSASWPRSRRVIPGENLGIHAHNDTGNAVANSLAAIRAGARQVQGTLNGLGERCGNANLVTLIPTLALKPELADHFETGVTPEALRQITSISRAFDELLNRAPNRHAPYVGASAFATKAGIHASALAKDPRTYEHVAPEQRRQRARRPRLGSGRTLEPHRRARPPRRRGEAGRSAPRAACSTR